MMHGNWDDTILYYTQRKSTNLDELGDEEAADVECNEGLEPPYEGTADEGGGCGGGIREGLDLVVVQVDDGGVDSDGGQEILHDVAHATGGAGEDDHWVLRY
ncbi:hypothetical protein PIB30_084346 [Stylosanthes scabra]|uniref:Uncharacterized protein n=1 Tax=Stylosanthes scabra TaxID=79078 RepID=A0ABU6UV80_9FABA|nr:hypothetical protein [Stylosanthes scabra]